MRILLGVILVLIVFINIRAVQAGEIIQKGASEGTYDLLKKLID